MSNIDYIINLCCEMSEQGKTPSVASIRNTATHPLSIPDVIKGLQHWRSNPQARPKTSTIEALAPSNTNQSLQQRVTELEKQVAQLVADLAKLSNH